MSLHRRRVSESERLGAIGDPLHHPERAPVQDLTRGLVRGALQLLEPRAELRRERVVLHRDAPGQRGREDVLVRGREHRRDFGVREAEADVLHGLGVAADVRPVVREGAETRRRAARARGEDDADARRRGGSGVPRSSTFDAFFGGPPHDRRGARRHGERGTRGRRHRASACDECGRDGLEDDALEDAARVARGRASAVCVRGDDDER